MLETQRQLVRDALGKNLSFIRSNKDQMLEILKLLGCPYIYVGEPIDDPNARSVPYRKVSTNVASVTILVINDLGTGKSSIIPKIDWDFTKMYCKVIFFIDNLAPLHLHHLYYLTGKVMKGKQYFLAICKANKTKPNYVESLLWPEYGVDLLHVSKAPSIPVKVRNYDIPDTPFNDMDAEDLINMVIVELTELIDRHPVIVCSKYEATLDKIKDGLKSDVNLQYKEIVRYSDKSSSMMINNGGAQVILMRPRDPLRETTFPGFKVVVFPMDQLEINAICHKVHQFGVKNIRLICGK